VFDFDSIVGFDWDQGNRQKNWEKHQVDYRECEEVFFNQPLLIHEDTKHSSQEKRYYVLGRSDTGRLLFLVFTIRNNKIRVISARDQSRKKERSMNSKHKTVPTFSNEDEEREFWATHDSSEYIDWNTAERNPTFSRLKPSTRTVSIRLPESLIASLKTLANKRDVPYQSLVKIFLAERVREETAQQHIQQESE